MRELIVKIDYNREAKTKNWWVWDSDVPTLMASEKTEEKLLSHIREVSRRLLIQFPKNFRREADDQYTVVVVREPFDTEAPARQVAKFSVDASGAGGLPVEKLKL